MKKKCILIFISLQISVVQGQNSGFETNTVNICRQNAGVVNPFFSNDVTEWSSANGTPQLNKSDCPSGQDIVHFGHYAAFLNVDNTNREGIFRGISVSKDESFNISIYAYGYSTTSKIIVKFTTGLVNISLSGPQFLLPVPTSSQTIIEMNLLPGWQEVRVNEFIANANYNQLWIYAENGNIAVDDVNVDKSCCEPYKIYQNIYDPPNTHVNDYILARNNVISGTQGDVVIKADAETTNWTAKNQITLMSGFSTEPNATFIAEIKPCSEVPMEVQIWEIPNNNIPQCTRQYQALACFGSGSYKYTWHDNHAEHLGSQKTSRTRSYAPNFTSPKEKINKIVLSLHNG